jgi:hypothetical protein
VFDWAYWGYITAFALLAWFPFGLWRFTRARPTVAAAQVMVWGMMWLPEGAAFDLPALPPISKYTISALAALIGVAWKAPARLRAARVDRGYDAWIVLMVLAQIGTVLTNQDPLHYGIWKTIDLPGFTAYDGISSAVRVLLTVGVPCVLGRALLRSERDVRDLFDVLAVAGVVYSLPILYEVRMSPMLHENIYGYSPRTDWLQNLRAGGYRPTVFMGHGLVVGFFMFLCTTAAICLHKAGRKRMFGLPMAAIVGYLFVTLLLCKAAAAIIYCTVGYAAIRYLGTIGTGRLLVGLALLVVSYPLTRIAEVFPVQGLISLAGMLGPERVQSLQFRFDNEDLLLLKGAERLWFGWGGYSRERVYDPETAKDLVIQDGHWISVFGTSGLLGFVCFFALMVLPLWQVRRAMSSLSNPEQRSLLAGLGFMVAICAVNMLPNMQLPYLQFVFASGLAALAAQLPKLQRQGLSQSPSIAPRAQSVRPSHRAPPMRPVWYGDAPQGAYLPQQGVAASGPPPAPNVIVAPQSEPAASEQTSQPEMAPAASRRPQGSLPPPPAPIGASVQPPGRASVAEQSSRLPVPPPAARVSGSRRPSVGVMPPPPAGAATAPPTAARKPGLTPPPPAGVMSAPPPSKVPRPAAVVSRVPSVSARAAPSQAPASRMPKPPPPAGAKTGNPAVPGVSASVPANDTAEPAVLPSVGPANDTVPANTARASGAPKP